MFGLVPALLFTLASLLSLYKSAEALASPDQILRPLVIVWACLFLARWLLQRTARGGVWTDVGISIFALAFTASPQFFRTTALPIFTASALWLVIRQLMRRKSSRPGILPFISLAGLYLVAMPLRGILPGLLQLPPRATGKFFVAPTIDLATLPVPAVRPDVYYVVLDGYGREDVLREYYDYDNSQFIAALRERGFLVPAEAHSNYGMTILSVASTLNMSYVRRLEPTLRRSSYWWLMSRPIDHSAVRTLLEQAGYQTVSVATEFGITDNDTTQHYLRPFPVTLTEFERFAVSSTPLSLFGPALSGWVSVPSYDSHRRYLQYSFEGLASIATMPGPKFVFVHVLAPHPPFVFLADGSPSEPEGAFRFWDTCGGRERCEQYRKDYIEQLKFVNASLLPVVDEILRTSSVPPIIILQADHGPGSYTKFASVTDTCIRERFSVFAAYYLPGMEPGTVPENITPVNVFRIVFSHYFDVPFPLLENRQLYNKATGQVFRTVNVSDRVNEVCPAAP